MENIVCLTPLIIGVIVGLLLSRLGRKTSFFDVSERKENISKFSVSIGLLVIVTILSLIFKILNIKEALNFFVGEIVGLIIIFLLPEGWFYEKKKNKPSSFT